MKKLSLFLLCFVGVLFSLQAQNKELTIEDAVVNQWRALYPEYRLNLMWKGTSDTYAYVKGYSELIEAKYNTTETTTLTTVAVLNSSLASYGIEKMSYFPFDFQWVNNSSIYFQEETHAFIYNTATKAVEFHVEIPENAENVTFCKENKTIAYTIENDLYIVSEKGTKTVASSDDENFVFGQSVSRNEFGINGGIFWSPKGNYLAFYKKDETDVESYPIVDVTTSIAEHTPIKYPMAGRSSEHVTLGVYDMNTGSTIYIENEPESEKYLTAISWEPSEANIYIAVLNREQNHMKFNKYDVKTGNFQKTLFEETNPKYVEPENAAIFLPNSSTEFLWYSERDGYKHLYQYNTDGTLLKQVTKGKWLVTSFLGFSKDGKSIFFTSTEASPLENNLYSVSLKNGNLQRITTISGTHEVQMNGEDMFIDEFSNTEIPRIINILDKDGKVVTSLLTAANPMKNYKLGTHKISTITAADGKTDLYYSLITPPDFDPTKKYPAIVYVYGGPHAQMITNSWLGGVGLWQYYMAQKGYVMLIVDNRGSDNRGLEFENVIHRQCGVNEMADQMKGVELLKSLGYVDMNRIGVHGWSYGGFMTISLMLNHNDVFKVGCAGGPVIDWKYYEVMYGERYMDTPEENPEGYEKASLLNKARNLEGKLLIIQGGVDPVVVWQHSQSFLVKCIEEGVLLDYFVYPTHEHNVSGMDRLHLMRKITQYFDENL